MLRENDIYVPILTKLHGTDITLVGSHPFYKPAVTFSINKSDAVTAVSQSLKDDTLRLFDIKNEINVVTNFIDINKFNHDFTDCQRAMMATDEEKIILFSGFSIAVIGIFLFLARDIILRRKTGYEEEDLESKKDKTFEK